MDKRIQDFRNRIDQIDAEILSLLVRRLSLADQMGNLKERLSLAVEDPDREQAIMERIQHQVEDQSLRKLITGIYRSIIQASKSVQ